MLLCKKHNYSPMVITTENMECPYCKVENKILSDIYDLYLALEYSINILNKMTDFEFNTLFIDRNLKAYDIIRKIRQEFKIEKIEDIFDEISEIINERKDNENPDTILDS